MRSARIIAAGALDDDLVAGVGQPGQDLLEPWADRISQWLTGDRLLMTRTHELLLASGCPVSYPSLHRFIVKRNWREGSRTTVRMADTPPGEVAESGFGRPGMIDENHPVRSTPYRKFAVAGEAVCSLVPQRGPVLSLQLINEQSAIRRGETRFLPIR